MLVPGIRRRRRGIISAIFRFDSSLLLLLCRESKNTRNLRVSRSGFAEDAVISGDFLYFVAVIYRESEFCYFLIFQ